MAQSLNRAMIIGRLGQDPTKKFTPSGKMVVTFSVATNFTKADGSGKTSQITDWHNCECWQGLAEVADRYLRKGRLVYIEGRMKTDKYTTKEGQTQYFHKIVVTELVFLDNAPKSEETQERPQPTDDDIPF